MQYDRRPEGYGGAAISEGCPAWLNANEGGSGYYRVRYEGAADQKLIDHVQKLELREKVDLLKNASPW